MVYLSILYASIVVLLLLVSAAIVFVVGFYDKPNLDVNTDEESDVWKKDALDNYKKHYE